MINVSRHGGPLAFQCVVSLTGDDHMRRRLVPGRDTLIRIADTRLGGTPFGASSSRLLQ